MIGPGGNRAKRADDAQAHRTPPCGQPVSRNGLRGDSSKSGTGQREADYARAQEWYEHIFEGGYDIEPTEFRCIGHGTNRIRRYFGTLESLFEELEHANVHDELEVYAVINRTLPETLDAYRKNGDGGVKDEDVDAASGFRACFVEIDKDEVAPGDNLDEVQQAPIPPSIIVQSSTTNKLHCYWLLADGDKLNEALWRKLQLGLIEYFNAGRESQNPSRVLRVPGFWHLKDKSMPRRVRLLKCDAARHSASALLGAFVGASDDASASQEKATGSEPNHPDLAPGAFELLTTAALHPPSPFQGRHQAVRAFLNLGERCNRRQEMLAFLQSDNLYKAWITDNSRPTLKSWQREVHDWSEHEAQSTRKLGIAFLKATGFKIDDLPRRIEPSGHEKPWSEMLPLPPKLPGAQTLPPDLIPTPLRPWLVDIAERFSVPLEMPASAALVTLGATIGRGLAIYPKEFDDWKVVPNLFGGICGPPGIMKSGVLSEATKPVSRLEAEALEQFKLESAKNSARVERLEIELDDLRRQMKAALKRGNSDSLDELEAALTGKKAELDAAAVIAKRYTTQDATVEKLGELLRDNARGLLIVRDELAGFLNSLERTGREGDREFYLEAWNGTSEFKVDRIGRGTIHIKAACISLLGGIQPGKLRRYITGALNDGGGADGLLQRLQVVVWPEHLGDWRNVDRAPDRAAAERTYSIFKALAELDGETLGLDDSETLPAGLRFGAAAQELFNKWRDELERRLRTSEIRRCPAFESHLSKYRSLMPSLALIFHLVDLADGQTNRLTVSLEAAKLAAAWCDYLEQHAHRIYAEETNASIFAAHALLAKIKEGVVKNGSSQRDLYRPQWSGLPTTEAVGGALEVLEQHNFLRVQHLETGGRPAQVVLLHPDLRTMS
jgi:hypothetical protein